MKGNKLAIACIALGLALLILAGAMVVRNVRETMAAARSISEALLALEAAVPETRAEETVPRQTFPSYQRENRREPEGPTDPTDPPTLSSEILGGREYVGYLIFPSLDRKLPVMKIVYLEDLQIAPCLQKGSPFTDDAVISAHNYPSHFGPIRDWEGGEEVIFSTLEGKKIHYTVCLVETIEDSDVDAVMESEFDLVLYTCTTGGEKRVMVACNRTEE